MRKNKIKPCPRCRKSGRSIYIIRSYDGSFPSRQKYFLECPTCHWCGKSRIFLFSAKMAWNRLAKKETKKCY